jgi:hypothetical protein
MIRTLIALLLLATPAAAQTSGCVTGGVNGCPKPPVVVPQDQR